MFRITAITANPDQPRSTLGDLSELMASIQRHGVLEPLLVRRRADGLYQLVAGERRFHAAMQAGLSEVPCIEVAVSDEQALEIALVENLQRQDLSAFEEAEGFHTLVTKYNYTHDKVAATVGRSRVTVTETLRLLELPEAVREACRHADISAKGILLEIAKARTIPAMLRLIQEIEAHQLDRDAIRDRRASSHTQATTPPTSRRRRRQQPPGRDPTRFDSAARTASSACRCRSGPSSSPSGQRSSGPSRPSSTSSAAAPRPRSTPERGPQYGSRVTLHGRRFT